MREAMLYEKLPDSRVRCNVCQWRCAIAQNKLGVCRARRNEGGVLFTLNYAEVTSAGADPVEKKPLYHFFPGSLCFSLGSWGCNFHCIHCQNWQISCIEEPSELNRAMQNISPEKSIELTKRNSCAGISWTYNEPAIWLEYTLDSAKLAKQEGLYTVYVTNGYMTPEGLDAMGPYLDAWRVDIKGFSDTLYKSLAKIPRWRGILDVAKQAKEKWDMHVEVITNIIPTMNDDQAQLEGIADWIYHDLGELTPWHVTRFYPHYQLNGLPATPIATLEKAYDIGKKAGLKFVYVGNVPGHDGENTVCYTCGNVVIKRAGYLSQLVNVNGSKCGFCGADLNIRTKVKGKV